MLILFMAFSGPTCHLEDAGIGVFWLHCAPYSKETKRGSSDQEASPWVSIVMTDEFSMRVTKITSRIGVA